MVHCPPDHWTTVVAAVAVVVGAVAAEVLAVDFGEVVAVASCPEDCHFSSRAAAVAASDAAEVDGVVVAPVAVGYSASAAADAGHTVYRPVPAEANHSNRVPI